ncbi:MULTISPECIES: sensor histidine kinase [Neorhizobium]|uniref:sensor histidine kinase n=1 Tax=Neorhizobium TaxID=1525371 RepID=UPI001FE113B2|nr:ATP-binding protein [Neorhizobium sp. T7_12]
MTSSDWLRAEISDHEMTRTFAAIAPAAVLVAAVFYIDAFTTIESAIAVLYVVALLLAAPILTRRGTIVFTVGCGALALVAYVVAHSDDVDVPSLLRLVVALSALTITSMLIQRTDLAHERLMRANQALFESETRYRSIFEQSRVALWERDYSLVREFLHSLRSRGVSDFRAYAAENPDIVVEAMSLIRTIDANGAARELLGLSPDEALPMSLYPYLSTETESILDMLDCVFCDRDRYEGKFRITSRDGTARDVLLSLRFPSDPSAFKRIAVGMFDITQRENTQRALRDAQAELATAARAATVGALSASLAHELNQPLGAIVMNAQTLLRWLDKNPPDLEAARHSAERMIRDGQRASDIILNARTILKPDKRILQDVRIDELVEETRALMDHDLLRENVLLVTDVEKGLPTVNAVRIEIQQVLINLISNGIQALAGKAGGDRVIHIRLGQLVPDALSLTVRDTGEGISPAIMNRLFDPFFTTKPTGMGIGLSICRHIMEGIGGSLTATNHDLGGAVFEMTIPIRATQ